MESFSWKLIDKYFNDNPSNLVAHHLDSYNSFFETGIFNIFKENNPIRFIERENKEEQSGDNRNEVKMYLGGIDGKKIYFGKPVIYDDDDKGGRAHYMYPNDARLRNMTYGITIHYDVEIEFTYYVDGEQKKHSLELEKMLLGRFPIMVQSNLCILKDLAPEVRFNMGECRNDYGGYFIINGKEKVIIPQEKFSDNMMYIRKNKADNIYSYSAEIRSVSEDASKPIRTLGVKVVAPTSKYTNNQIVVTVPNVKKPVPLFILMRALGVESDKEIIEYCLLDLDKNASYVDLFIPSVHDANMVFNQETALEYIALLTKRQTKTAALDILINYFLPHIGEQNLLDKAYYVGYMVNRLLRVFTKEEKPTDRDNFCFKRIELSGMLIYDLFREYYLIQKKAIGLSIDKKYYYNLGKYKDNFIDLIEGNYPEFFKDRAVETGFRKGFNGNWGSETHTKRVGLVQDLNRLSWNSFISHLRKLNLPIDSSAKVTGPRLLNSSQWGYIDPVDTPDGGNIGLHKHLAISTHITSGYSGWPLIKWIRAKTALRLLQECKPLFLASLSKVFVNGVWIGAIEHPIEFVNMMRLFRRNGVLPVYTSVSFKYEANEIYIYSDGGRLTRPIYYISNGRASYDRADVVDKINSGKFSWQDVVGGIGKKEDEDYNYKKNTIYDIDELYSSFSSAEQLEKNMEQNQSVVDYVDTSEEEGLMVAMKMDELKNNKYYTNVEILPSLIFGVMGNQIIYPENNPTTRSGFSCGQSKQAVSVYHSNFQMRMDKFGVTLNYGQIPLVKSKYLEYFNKEEQPYGVNVIVAIMSYTGYNVEDAILINEGAIKRGLFNTTYYTTYESREESASVGGSQTSSTFADISKKHGDGFRLNTKYDYGQLDEYGIIRENTKLNDTMAVIGKMTYNIDDSDHISDASVFPKKGQLGYVDKTFITEGEEGFRVAKVRVREERIPAIGDKMASRAGQKGTLGLIIPEEDMPFNAEGIRPDLIINPHAIPSRMTIGQLIESLLGVACLNYGGFGDCTAFETKGSNTEVYGSILTNAGYNSSGNQIFYNGMTGEQLYSEIFIGPTYYMRLKHMVKDKINFRARGPNTALTRQSVHGRANDGGLRIGEMERDGIMAHGASAFLNESFMVRCDEYYMAVCNKTGCTAIYNESKNLFLSPFADGPITFNQTMEGDLNVENISRFGRSFSIIRIPYALKLLIQELQVMNIQVRIITEDNIDQLKSMTFSKNMATLLDYDELKAIDVDNKDEYINVVNLYRRKMNETIRANDGDTNLRNMQDAAINVSQTPSGPQTPDGSPPLVDSPPWAPGSPAYDPNSPAYAPGSPQYPPGSPQYNPNSPAYAPGSPQYPPQTPSGSPPYAPGSPAYNPNTSSSDTPTNIPPPPSTPPSTTSSTASGIKIQNPDTKAEFDALNETDKDILMKMVQDKKEKSIDKVEDDSILNIDEKDKEETKPKEEDKTSSETKKINYNPDL